MKPQIIDRFVYVKGKKISEVENTGTLHGKELIPVADNNQNFHTTVDQISEYVDNSHDYLTTEDYNNLKGQIDSERTNRQEADNELNQSIQDTKSELHSTISNVESELLNEVNDLQGQIDNINDTGIANGVTLDTVQTITGKKTFITVPKSTADATEDTDLVNKKYVDDTVANVDVDLDGYATQTWVNEQGFAKTSDIPEVPTKVSAFANDVGYQTEEQVNTAIQAVVDAAPEALDTLKELADALNNDPDFASTVTNQLTNKYDKTGGAINGNVAITGDLTVNGDEVLTNSNYESIIGDVLLKADEEDVTNEDGKLKLKDRLYDAENFSGKGYKILRKNIVEEKNVLTQDMINQANTIYKVRYDFDLNGATITIPENCTLKFEGGSLSNGTVSFNNTFIECANKSFKNCVLSGNIFTNQIKVYDYFIQIDKKALVFLMSQIGNVDYIDFESMQTFTIDITNDDRITYELKNGISTFAFLCYINNRSNTVVDFKGSTLNITESFTADSSLIVLDHCNNITIRGLNVSGDESKISITNNVLTNTSDLHTIRCIHNCSNITVSDVNVTNIQDAFDAHLWDNETTRYNLINSNIQITAENVRYPIRASLVDNCNFTYTFNKAHRGGYFGAITNSTINVEGRDANETMCNCLLRDAVYTDSDDIKHFVECKNLNITVTDTGSEKQDCWYSNLTVSPYHDQELFQDRTIPYNFSNINVTSIFKKKESYTYDTLNFYAVSVSKASGLLNSVIDVLQVNCNVIDPDNVCTRYLSPVIPMSVKRIVNIKDLTGSTINQFFSVSVSENDTVTLDNVRVNNLQLRDSSGKLLLINNSYIDVFTFVPNDEEQELSETCVYLDDTSVIRAGNGIHTNKLIDFKNKVKPINPYKGFEYFDPSTNLPTWWNGTEWINAVDTSNLATSDDLSGYLPLSGGTVSGNLQVDSSVKLRDNNDILDIKYSDPDTQESEGRTFIRYNTSANGFIDMGTSGTSGPSSITAYQAIRINKAYNERDYKTGLIYINGSKQSQIFHENNISGSKVTTNDISGGLNITSITQSAYNELQDKDANTLYIITE